MTGTRGVHEGMSSPWGRVQTVTFICDGIWSVGTAGHGGIKLDRAHNARMPEYMRMQGGWYEEDCEWCLPFCVFEAEIILDCKDEYTGKQLPERHHWHMFINAFPDEYERFMGVELKPGESRKRDEETWHRAHENDLIVVSAVGDWHESVPKGMVGVGACVGGRDRKTYQYRGPIRHFLLPADEYKARDPFGFVVDPVRHQEATLGEQL